MPFGRAFLQNPHLSLNTAKLPAPLFLQGGFMTVPLTNCISQSTLTHWNLSPLVTRTVIRCWRSSMVECYRECKRPRVWSSARKEEGENKERKEGERRKELKKKGRKVISVLKYKIKYLSETASTDWLLFPRLNSLVCEFLATLNRQNLELPIMTSSFHITCEIWLGRLLGVPAWKDSTAGSMLSRNRSHGGFFVSEKPERN